MSVHQHYASTGFLIHLMQCIKELQHLYLVVPFSAYIWFISWNRVLLSLK